MTLRSKARTARNTLDPTFRPPSAPESPPESPIVVQDRPDLETHNLFDIPTQKLSEDTGLSLEIPQPPTTNAGNLRVNNASATEQLLQTNQLLLPQETRDKLTKNPDGFFTDRAGRVVLHAADTSAIQSLIHRCHTPHHSGINRTLHELRHFSWKNKHQDVSRFVQNCTTCQLVRRPALHRSAVGTLPWWETVQRFGMAGIVGIDICQGLGDSRSLLSVTCAVSKWIRAATIEDFTASTVIDTLKEIFEQTLFPRVIITDNGSCFKARDFTVFCESYGITQLKSPAYASTYNGWFERSHKYLLDQLRLLRADHPAVAWWKLLPTALHLINSRPYQPTGEPTPFPPLRPIDVIFGNSRIPDIIVRTSTDTDELQLLKECGLAHLLKEAPDWVHDIATELQTKRLAAIEEYQRIFENKRRNIRKQLESELPPETLSTDYLPVGSWARVYRPTASKISSNYSAPKQIIEAPSAATRLVKATNDTPTLEYIGNLIPVERQPGNFHDDMKTT